jgi:hypothetical protein
MMKKAKTGRRSSPNERERASELVRAYRKENPAIGELVDDGQPARSIDAEFLVAALEHFALHGTFAGVFDGRHVAAQQLASKAGPGYKDRIREVVDGMHVSERTAARLLSK